MTLVVPRGVPEAPVAREATQPILRQSDTKEAPLLDAAPEATAAKTEELSPRFAAIARKERAMRQQQQAIKAEREAFLAEKSAYESRHVASDRLKQDPLAVLREQGVTYEQLTDLILNGKSEEDPTIAEIRAELKAVKDAQGETQTRLEAEQKKAYESAVNKIRTDATLLVESNPEFETIKDMGAVEAVVELIKETHAADGTILSVSEAATQVEEYLLTEALKMAQLSKVKARLAPAQDLGAQKPQSPLEQQQPPIRTLTNSNTASLSKPASRKERRERAMLAGMGKL